jgi:hypothetical protein
MFVAWAVSQNARLGRHGQCRGTIPGSLGYGIVADAVFRTHALGDISTQRAATVTVVALSQRA